MTPEEKKEVFERLNFFRERIFVAAMHMQKEEYVDASWILGNLYEYARTEAIKFKD